MKFANLHLHSTYSDATFTPRQLVLLAKSLGYGALALTDHETHGGVPEIFSAAKAEGLDAISGVEFHCDLFHITALDFDMDDPGFNAFVKLRCELYAEYTRKVFERAIRLGYIEGYTWNDLLDSCDPGSWICVDHVRNFLWKKNLISRSEDNPELIKKMYANPEAKSFYPELAKLEDIIKVIRKAGGVACLAHPENQLQYVPELVDLGINGIEVCHPMLGDDPLINVDVANVAKTYNLYRSGGTDHTGAMSSHAGVHARPAYHGVDEEDYYILKERRLG